MRKRCLRGLEELLEKKSYRLLIEALKEDVLSPSDICRLLQIPKINSKSYGRIVGMIDTIGNYYPVYEPIPNNYKILTQKDMDQYYDEYSKQKKHKEEQAYV